MKRLSVIPILYLFLTLGSCTSTKDSTFQDCKNCPEMVVVPAGSFQMGDISGNSRHYNETPVHPVIINYSFAVGKYEVTNDEWNACVAVRGCLSHSADEKFRQGSNPVVYVSWNNAKDYVRWLSDKTGRPYRLLSESEWEYVARAGTSTRYHFGNQIKKYQANFGKWINSTSQVGIYPPNSFGLFDMSGNAWEWTEDCYQDNYNGVPSNGDANPGPTNCRRVVRGGDWGSSEDSIRSARRYGYQPSYQFSGSGFRVALDLF